MALLSRLAALAGLLAAASAGSCDTVFVQNSHFVDSCGRSRLFRGVNSVQKGAPYIFDYTNFQPNGGSIAPADAALWQSLGFNSVRFGTMWAGVQPTPDGVVNSSYVELLAETSLNLFDYGIYSLLDAHQDLFSEAFCADGVPSWLALNYSAGAATFPAPLGPPNSGCGLSWGDYYVTEAVCKAFGVLYSERGVRDFTVFWRALLEGYAAATARRAASRGERVGQGGSRVVTPAVLALELLNEPWAGDVYADPLIMVPGVADRQNLQPFFANLSAAIDASTAEITAAALGVGAEHVSLDGNSSGIPLAVEPVTWDNFVPVGYTSLPGATSNRAVLSYHYYSLPDIIGSEWQVAAREADASRLGAVGWLTEFDVDLLNPVNAPYSNRDLRATMDACDKYGHGYLGWAYSSIWTGAQGNELHIPAVRELSRPFLMAAAAAAAPSTGGNATVSGSFPASYRFTVHGDTAPANLTATFTLSYAHSCDVGAAVAAGGSSAPTDAPTVLYLPSAFWYPNLLRATSGPAAAANISVTSSIAGAVDAQIVVVPGAVSPDLPGGSGVAAAQAAAAGAPASQSAGVQPPAPFAYAILTISNAAGSACPAGAAPLVSVTVVGSL